MRGFLMFAQPFAVIADNDDQRAVVDAEPQQRLKQTANVPVHVSNLRVVRTSFELIAELLAVIVVRCVGIKKMDPAKEWFGLDSIQPGDRR